MTSDLSATATARCEARTPISDATLAGAISRRRGDEWQLVVQPAGGGQPDAGRPADDEGDAAVEAPGPSHALTPGRRARRG